MEKFIHCEKINNFHQLETNKENTASKQPRRSDLTSYLKFVAQTTYATMFVWTVLKLFFIFLERKKEERKKNI